MGIRESLLNTITSVGSSDFVRIVTSAGASSKATVQNLFKSFETGLGAKSSLTTSDYIRVVGSDNNLYKQSINSVAEVVNSVLNSKTTQTFTSPKATGSGLVSKVGQVVTMHLSFEGYTATSTSWQSFCELPSGYRPSRQIDVLLFDNAARNSSEQPLQFRISPSGTVQFYAFTAKTYNPYGCVTFII